MRSIPEWSSNNHDAAIPPKVKLRILERDGETCQGPCHRKLRPGDKFHFDHKIPLRDGGTHSEGNLQTMCDGCHGIKTGLEATARAKVQAMKKQHYGIKSSSSLSRRDGRYKFNWRTRRYEKLTYSPPSEEQ